MSKAIIRVCVWFCLSVCLSVCPHDKPKRLKLKSPTETWHRDNPSRYLANQLILGHKVKGQGRAGSQSVDILKAIEWQAWVMHLCTLSSAQHRFRYFFTDCGQKTHFLFPWLKFRVNVSCSGLQIRLQWVAYRSSWSFLANRLFLFFQTLIRTDFLFKFSLSSLNTTQWSAVIKSTSAAAFDWVPYVNSD